MRRDDSDNRLRQETVGRFLKRKRLEANLTQWDVARELDYTTAQFVSNWERGAALPPLTVLPHIADLYAVAPALVIDTMQDYERQVQSLELEEIRRLLLGRSGGR